MSLLYALFILLVKVTAVLTAVLFLLYVYELKNSHGLGWLQRQTGEPPLWSLLKSALMAWGSQVMVATTYVLGYVPWLWERPRLLPSGDTAGPTVLLVHGLYHNPSAWLLLRRRLRRAGFTDIRTFAYSSWDAEFFSIARSLEARIAELSTSGKGLVLVGHSLGGLLVRHVMSSDAVQGQVLGAVTLGAPHGGSKLAALGIGRLARSLVRGGELVQRIRSLDRRPPVPCVSYYSPVDEFVTPPDGLRLALQGWEERQTPAMSHVAMLYHPWVADALIGLLRNEGRRS